jgi:DNA repair exonuclease SbcCD ATPase subunit
VRISKVTVKNYGCFKTRSFDLGPNVNLLTASNGTGKTTLCSAIVWGLYGKHLREIDQVPGSSVRLEFGSTITRSLNGRGETVELTGHSAMNKTRFSEVMMPVLGEYGAWSKSLWVTGSNVANFSQGSPKDRFQYLSKIVGAAQFDVYLEKLKARYTEVKGHSERYLLDAPARSAMCERHWSDLVQVNRSNLGGFRAPAAAPRDLAQLEQRLQEAGAELEKIRIEHDAAETAHTDFLKAEGEPCVTCGQGVRPKDWSEQNSILHSLRDSLARRKYAAVRVYTDLQTDTKNERIARHRQANLNDIINNAEKDLLARAEKLYERSQEIEHQTREALGAQAEAADLGVLGQCVKQAKHDYLASAASAITKTTNHYLSVIGTDYVVSIDYVDEALVVNLHQGPVKTYSKLSSGQKRRVDICLCLAMSQLAATVGTVPKTAPLIIDEAFDTLDNQGVEALISLSCEIAKERQVILVSHAEPSAPLGPQVARISL